ncbi:MAG TPA: cellulose synthase family protein [Nitrososphaeraceae archaeon]|nr:cellulose synthase family protein [Nitrososphaeraceae archaeon]
MSVGVDYFLSAAFLFAAWTLTLYSLNFFFLLYYLARRKRAKGIEVNISQLPMVTIQLPLYNEKYVSSRLIDAVCNMDYPKDRLEIQVLDDSEDESREAVLASVQKKRLKGFNIHHISRQDRSGFKAGALRMGMRYAKGEFIAIFDADFVPPPEFLKKSLRYFSDSRVGLVQSRWGHMNENYSTLTGAQALSLDLHFLIEQNAKSSTHLFVNFNGTAGVWRTSCIKDAGGWHTGTLVEDMDLSFRAQMKGWRLLFDKDIVVSGELPVQMNAAKRQQFRWAKGTTQLALKLLGELLLSKRIPVDTKFQAFIQLTRHVIYPMFLAQFILFPILLNTDNTPYRVAFSPYLGLFFYVLLGPVAYMYMIWRLWPKRWASKARQYWILLFFATGISVNNTIAVFDAILSKKNEFLRTPKFGIVKRSDRWRDKDYVLPFNRTTLLEIFFSLYGCLSAFICIYSGSISFLPIILLQTIGLIYVTYLSIVDSRRKLPIMSEGRREVMRPQNPTSSTSENISNINGEVPTSRRGKNTIPGFRLSHRRAWNAVISKAVLLVFLVLLAGGAIAAIYGYQYSIYPLDKSAGYLSRAQAAQSPHLVFLYLNKAKGLIPPDGNPVWTFPNPRTDFTLISREINAMQERALTISGLKPQSAEYNTALEDLHSSIRIIEMNLIEVQPYVYGSLNNIIFTGIWIGLILLTYNLIRRMRRKLQETEPS